LGSGENGRRNGSGAQASEKPLGYNVWR
jgi:hypothetical protein